MFSIIKRILKKRTPSQIDQYKVNGNLKVGASSAIPNLHIDIFHDQSNCNNIVIGKDCLLSGSITVYSPNAKIVIGDRVFIGPGTKLICYDELIIEDDVMLSWDVTIMDTNAHSLKSKERINDVVDWGKGWRYKNWSCVESKKIIIKRKSWIGFNSIVTKGVTLGEGTVVASGSVVTKSTEDYTVVGGNPAKFIKKTE